MSSARFANFPSRRPSLPSAGADVAAAPWPHRFHFLAQLVDIVSHQQRRDDQHAGLAAWSRGRFRTLDPLVDLGGHRVQMVLLAVLAAERVGEAVDAKGNLRHALLLRPGSTGTN